MSGEELSADRGSIDNRFDAAITVKDVSELASKKVRVVSRKALVNVV